ncbi:hypothetical protein ACFYNY_21115 [Streptomyces sp. NPDC006530]|uniref:hypothetical protein n=1 Tax=Streptomyces sp. NPDC006530 TaxID=3364750 RepID=UPI0036C16CB4
MLATALTACGPYQYYDGTGIHDATAAEVVGAWENIEGTHVVLRKDGTALIEKLDGEGFDFDYGWRLSGTGTWRLADASGGQTVRLTLTTQTRVESRSPEASSVGESSPQAPRIYTWFFHVDRDRHDEVRLFFFYGNPDTGNTYAMNHETGS